MHLSSDKRIYWRKTKEIISLTEKYRDLSDEKLQAKTIEFKRRLDEGATLDEIMVEAYATVCEADRRVLDLSPFPVQILGAVAMQDGNIIEMKTGEGKTLTATMIMYLHGLTGPGNFLITANAYLANRDTADMGRVYKWLGLTISSGVAPDSDPTRELDKKKIYSADIVYTTNNALGFDYLFDNLAATKAEQYLSDFQFGLLDEVDAILLDTATTPLIISGGPHSQSNLYQLSDNFVTIAEEDLDFERSQDLKDVWYTSFGIKHMEQYFSVDHILDEEWIELYRHLVLALKAHYLFVRDRDYTIDEGEVFLLDQDNGRKLEGMKLESGMHQAIEAKERVKISNEQSTMAMVTYQNLFRMFHQLTGMTGTAATDASEFREVYNLNVFKVPTNRPNIRKDKPDRLYITNEAKLRASVEVVKDAYARNRPVLVETGSLALSNLFSRLLLAEGIPHSLLNARSAAKEARIVSEAGQKGVITVATSMAGRGTDIHLEDGVTDLGGLLVLGTERMESPRVDNQLRGRAGRQGDPGESQFYTSLEDKVVVKHGSRQVRRWQLRNADRPTQLLSRSSRFHKAIDRAQRSSAGTARSQRFSTLQYGEVFRVQRDTVYAARDEILENTQLDTLVQEIFKKSATQFVEMLKDEENVVAKVSEFIYQNIDRDIDTTLDLATVEPDVDFFLELMDRSLRKQRDILPQNDQWLYFLRVALLRAIDRSWMLQVDNLQQMRALTSNRSTGGRNPLFEYQKEARRGFMKMKEDLNIKVTSYLLTSELVFQKDGTIDVIFP